MRRLKMPPPYSVMCRASGENVSLDSPKILDENSDGVPRITGEGEADHLRNEFSKNSVNGVEDKD